MSSFKWPAESGGSGGSGDVTGPGGTTDNAVARFDGTTGKVIQSSGATIDDSGNLATPGSVTAGSVSTPGNITVGGTVDGRDVSTDGSTLDAQVTALSTHTANQTAHGSTSTNTASKIVQRDSNSRFSISAINFDTAAGDPSYAEGRLFYDPNAKSMAYYNESSTVKLNIGQENYLRVANVTASIISNGTVVYITGSSGGLPTIAPAQANALATVRSVGVTTQDISATTGIGYVTTLGIVNNIDTSAFTAGARLFLSATTPGALTATAPSSPNYSTPIGYVVTVNAVSGQVFVDGGIKSQIGRGTANQLRGVNASATEEELKTIQGTANEVSVTHGVGSVTLGLPNAISNSVPLVVSTTQTMLAGREYLANTTSAAFTLTFPAGVLGARIRVRDDKRTWQTNNLTLAPATGESIAGQAANATLVMNIQGSWGDFVYDGATWVMVTIGAGFANPMTAVGDIIYGGTTGLPTRLAGAAGVLKGAVGSAPSYSTIVNADVSASAAIDGSKITPVFTGAATIGNTSTANFRHTVNGGVNVLSARSRFTANSETFAIGLKYNTAGSEFYLGADSTDSLQFSSAGGSPIGIVTQAGAWTLGSTTGQHQIKGGGSSANALNISTQQAGDAAFRGIVITKVDNNSTTSQKFVLFQINAGAANSGGITANGANTAAFETISDARLKENITNLPSQLESILALRPVEFDYKEIEGVCSPGHSTGFIAQEMEEVFPEAVATAPDTGYKSIVGWSSTEARLVKAIQEQQALIDALTDRLTALESK